MFQHRLDDQAGRRTYIDWFILSFLAGIINTGGYLSCQRFVSHVTGFATLAGISFQKMDWFGFFATLLIPSAFLAGVVVSAYLTEKQFAHFRHGQRFAPVMQIIVFLMLAVTFLGHWGYFGEFGSLEKIKNDYLLSAILCMACGLQNGAITLASGATVRTTHLTGITTDLGLGLVRSCLPSVSGDIRLRERRANKLRLGTLVSFIGGAIIGAFTFINFKFDAFLLPACIALYFSYVARSGKNTLNSKE